MSLPNESVRVAHNGRDGEHAVSGHSPASARQDKAQWLWLIWGERSLLWRVTLYGLLISIVTSFLIPSRYQSTTRLMPPDTQSGSGMGLAMIAALAGSGSGSSGLKALAGDFLGVKSSGALFMEIMKSRTVQDRLVNQFDLRKVYSERLWEDARIDLTKRTDISEDRKSGVLSITVADRNPRRAAQLAQAYVDELDRLVAEVSTSSARRERMFIEQRLKSVKQDLDKASQQFSDYASKNSTLDIKDQAKATVEAAARLQGAFIAAQSELEGLEQIYSSNNVRVRSTRARVAELQHELQKMSGSGVSAPDDGRTDLPSIRSLPILGVRWADLYREVKVQETVYELLTQQYEVAKIQEAKSIPTVKVLDAANVPERRSSPRRAFVTLFGTTFALAAGLFWIIGRKKWHDVDPEDPRKQLSIEVVKQLKSTALRMHRNGSHPEKVRTSG
ncbi:MAG: lipopolysaccharide biosynthesis protein [Acidobacteria bacterium]|nr:lipopolysaccharide biosynthesis protein [Acidobacteriota bacterium]